MAISSATWLMTLDIGHGPVQVLVDTQAGSKSADDKRKRNAGASARFRQRRKDKERESSQAIAKLENQVREVGKEREHYKQQFYQMLRERDYYKSLVDGTHAPLPLNVASTSWKQFEQSTTAGNVHQSAPQPDHTPCPSSYTIYTPIPVRSYHGGVLEQWINSTIK
ncbi:MAG: hypothetical protein MMC33_009140 [Icmadophila ericetorum]|nr:hypothetical protein [Icmadophila ericetorum]